MELTGLKDKTSVVTGASRGIGRAIALVLAKSGVNVVCCARNEELLIQVCAEIEEEGGRAISVKTDVTSADDRKHMLDKCISAFGGVDFLINNAGIHLEKSSLELSDEEIRRVMDVNFIAMFSLSRDAAGEMVKRGGGKIVNMGSFWGQLGVRKQVAYCTSKAAIEAMTRCMAVELARNNIQVNAVAPGHIMTDISKGALENEKLRNLILSKIPAKRIGEPEEVAYFVAFLCSQQSDYITGHVHCVDGGQLISW
ncbi:MAG: SDR family oxidoreductase [Desulfobacteraceae bacterium]|nr:SDR family oxidoreductase [Desulfobacteraceae bacterium]